MAMLIHRLGNKRKIADKISANFPAHNTYIEPFFGAGGMFFNKDRAKYNIVNDQDSDVFNLFMCVLNNKDELYDLLLKMPIHYDLYKYWLKHKEEDPIRRAARFIMMSNYTYLGRGSTLKVHTKNTTSIMLSLIDETHKRLFNVDFMNCDFREMFKMIPFKNDKEKEGVFIYCDPPYIKTRNNYEKGFSTNDCIDLFDTLEGSGCKFGYSEFKNDYILDQAKQRGLNVIEVCERVTLKSRNTEILVTNYEKNVGMF